jgi:2-methylcitrate dehydratase PrpD
MPMENGPNSTQSFARSLMTLSLGAADVEHLGNLLLDYIGVSFCGARQPWVIALLRWAERYANSGPCGLIGRGFTVAPDIAGFVNGVAAHSFELDDTHDVSLSHPGAVLFPTALAIAADVKASGIEVLTAVAAGYETMARLGATIDARRIIAHGFHPTALLGVFGAATAAARTLRLSEHGLQCAWGHALSLTGGSMQFSQDPDGADVKRMHAGYAARNGVLAAQMAHIGIGAPSRSLDGRYGFLALFGAATDSAPLLTAPAPKLAIHDVSLKPYACNRLLHSMIDGLRELTGFDLESRAVTRIVVRGPRKLVDQHVIRRPKTPMAAQYSLPFTVGAAFVFGPENLSAYDVHNLDDPRVLEWADKTEVVEDAELEAKFPEHFGTKVELTMASGEIRSLCVLDSLGTPRRPMDRASIKTKMRGLLSHHAPEDFERLASAAETLSTADSTACLQSALAISA